MTRKSTWEQRAKTLEQRFWEKVNKTSGCWLWTSAIGTRGYGIFWVGAVERSKFAHRLSYEMSCGPIPGGLVVMHSCDTPACVNPAHLSVGTSGENTRDALKKGRMPIGERNKGGGKLKDADVAEIKRLSASREMSISGLSRRYGVSMYVIKCIRRGKLWKHVASAKAFHSGR